MGMGILDINLPLRESLNSMVIKYRIFLCFMDSGLARHDQTSSPPELASNGVVLSLVNRIFLYE
jgi:hypothetical protein